MAREMVAMWRTASGLVGVPGQVSPQGCDAMWNPGDATTPESARSKSGWRAWIPTLERTPPLVQFIVRAMQWFRVKCRSSATPTPQLRLVGQLALGGKRHLSLVEVGGVQFLVGGGVEHVTVIVPIPNAGITPTENPLNAGRPYPL
ncbi:MAG: flagellar biosynthetic protein FliO [Acidobacteriaceae bacterium]